jgi:hypothetical protein
MSRMVAPTPLLRKALSPSRLQSRLNDPKEAGMGLVVERGAGVQGFLIDPAGRHLSALLGLVGFVSAGPEGGSEKGPRSGLEAATSGGPPGGRIPDTLIKSDDSDVPD